MYLQGEITNSAQVSSRNILFANNRSVKHLLKLATPTSNTAGANYRR